MILREIITVLEDFAPLTYQETYDNAGLLVGFPDMEVTAALLTLDTTEAVIDEAIALGCNLVIAHHPIVFSGMKKFNGKTYVERVVMKAIKNDIAIYAAHTNLDNVTNGVNFKIAEKLGLHSPQILSPKSHLLQKLTVFVPETATEPLLTALYAAGAGQIGKYQDCSFLTWGEGRFTPDENANPAIGQPQVPERVAEARVEVIFPAFKQNAVLAAMRAAHPYEEVAYYLQSLDNRNQAVGSGLVGELPTPLPVLEFMGLLKQQLELNVIKYTALCREQIKRVAVCGGSGSFLLGDARRSGADIFITADFKYHEYFDAENKIIIADIGHYESEQFTKELFRDIIYEKIPNFATYLSKVNTNPVNYFY